VIGYEDKIKMPAVRIRKAVELRQREVPDVRRFPARGADSYKREVFLAGYLLTLYTTLE